MLTQDKILEKIYKSALKFLLPLTPEETYKLIVDEAIKLSEAENGSILLSQDGELKRIYASDPAVFEIQPRKRGNTYTAFREQRPIIAGITNTGRAHPILKDTGIQSSIFIPLSYHRTVLGVLTLNARIRKQFTDKELQILKFYGSMASLAIRKTQLYDEAKKALKARDLFISMAAHELRTPLTSISGYIQMLYSKFAGADTVESKWIQELVWESHRLTLLVNELLEVERIRTGRFNYNLRECSLKEIIDRALLDFRFNHPEHKILQVDRVKDGKDKIIGDSDKLLQVVINLLNNAAKFSSSECRIIVSCKSQLHDVVLSIKDKGRGISKKDMPNIFERFFRGNNHSREGIGLGLFLAKNIISFHHGTIKVKSKENKGTTVEIRLPLVKYQ